MVRIAQIVLLDLLHERGDLWSAGQHGRHHHQGAAGVGDTLRALSPERLSLGRIRGGTIRVTAQSTRATEAARAGRKTSAMARSARIVDPPSSAAEAGAAANISSVNSAIGPR